MPERIFNPNNYTEESNPILYSIADMLFSYTGLSECSNKVEMLANEHSHILSCFENTLSDMQWNMFERITENFMQEDRIIQMEAFVAGVKLSANLFTEMFGKELFNDFR